MNEDELILDNEETPVTAPVVDEESTEETPVAEPVTEEVAPVEPPEPTEEQVAALAAKFGYVKPQPAQVQQPQAPRPAPELSLKEETEQRAKALNIEEWDTAARMELMAQVSYERTERRIEQIEAQAAIPIYEREMEQAGLPKETGSLVAQAMITAKQLGVAPELRLPFAKAMAAGIHTLQNPKAKEEAEKPKPSAPVKIKEPRGEDATTGGSTGGLKMTEVERKFIAQNYPGKPVTAAMLKEVREL